MALMTGRATFCLAAAAGAALIALGWLQYRWIGQLGEAGQERMKTRLNVSLARFSEEFQRALARPLSSLTGEADATPGDFARNWQRWSATEPDAALVRAAFISQGGPNGTGELRRLDPLTGSFQAVPWPPELERLRAQLWLLPQPPARPEVRDEALVGVARPLVQLGPGWVILQFDQQYLKRDLLPRLVRQHIDPDYEIRISPASRPNNPVYVSDDSLPPGFFAQPDAELGMLDLPARRPRGSLSHAALSPPHWVPEGRGLWRIQVKSRSGTLEEMVAQTRRRNLAASFGILLLAAASIAMLVVSSRRAQRLAEAQMAFVAGVSHELRTPLAVICSAADNLADGVAAGEQQARRYGDVIRTEGRRLARMVEQILAFAGIQKSRERLECRPLPCREAIDDALKACQADLHAAGFEVRASVPADLPLVVADRTALAHSLRNLIENALTHAREGGIVDVSARCLDGLIEFEVKDRGPGIPREELARIFEPFHRGREARARQRRGFGLGLALVKQMTEMQNGSVAVESDTGQGCTFRLRLPASV